MDEQKEESLILRPAKWVIPALSAVCFFIALILFISEWDNGPRWKNNMEKGNDLLQHYAAGQLVRAGKMSDLWHDSRLLLQILSHPVGHAEIPPPAHPPYTFNYVYPPLVAVIFSWLGRLPYAALYVVWILTGLAGSGLALYLLHRGKIGLSELLVLGGYPAFAFSILMGQNTLISFLVIAGAGFFLDKKRPFLAGLILSGMFYKPPILGVLGILFLFAGWYFIAAGLFAGMLAWQVLTILICGIDSLLGWLGVMLQMLSGTHSQNHSLGITWTEFFWSMKIDFPLFRYFVCGAGMLILICYAFRLRRAGIKAGGKEFFLLVMVTLPLLPYAQVHELMLAFPAFTLAEKEMRTAGTGRLPELTALLLWWVSGLLALNLILNTHQALMAPVLTLAAVILICRKERIQPTRDPLEYNV